MKWWWSAKDKVSSRSRTSIKSISCVPAGFHQDDHAEKEDNDEKQELIMDKDDDHGELLHDDDDKEEDEEPSSSNSTSLTVWRKSLLLTCSGFTVINADGNLAYRVDNYSDRPGEVVLMDGTGKCVLTICRRKNLVADDWLVYDGDHDHHHNNSNRRMMMMNCPLQTLIKRIIFSKKHREKQQQQRILEQKQQPVYCVKKQRMNVNHIFPSSTSSSRSRRVRHMSTTTTTAKAITDNNKAAVLAHVYLTNSTGSRNEHQHHRQKPDDVDRDYDHRQGNGGCKKWPVYVVEGSYCNRTCTVWDYDVRRTNNSGIDSRRPPKVVAEVKRKEAVNVSASFGPDVFHLIVRPGFDPDFAMGLVLLLDQMFT